MTRSKKQEMKQIDYDHLAAEYALHRQVQPEVLVQLVFRGEITRKLQVLEVGCGTGNYISAIQSATDCQCFGIDPSIKMLTKARNDHPGIDYRLGRGEDIEFDDDFFDFVYSVDVIHHLKDQLRYFREAFRVLKPGGRLATVTESSWMIRTRIPFSVYFPETVAVDLDRYPKVSFMRDAMLHAGFEEIYSHAVTFSFTRTDIQDFRDKVYSCLHLITGDGFDQGIKKMEADLERAPIPWDSRYLLLWGKKAKGIGN